VLILVHPSLYFTVPDLSIRLLPLIRYAAKAVKYRSDLDFVLICAMLSIVPCSIHNSIVAFT